MIPLKYGVKRWTSQLVLILVIMLLASVFLIFWLCSQQRELESQIEARDRTLLAMARTDSLYCETVEDYSKTISKYVGDNRFTIDGRSISTEELVAIANRSLTRVIELEDSLFNLRRQLLRYDSLSRGMGSALASLKLMNDSGWVASRIVELIQRDYGITYRIVKDSTHYVFVRQTSKVDTALLLLPSFRSRIRRDTVSGSWLITRCLDDVISVPEPDRPKKRREKRGL